MSFFVFDVLRFDGVDAMALPYDERRAFLETLPLPKVCQVPGSFDDGEMLFEAVSRRGLEGVVAKRRSECYRQGQRRWVKVKNRDYWRYPSEIAAAERKWRSTASMFATP